MNDLWSPGKGNSLVIEVWQKGRLAFADPSGQRFRLDDYGNTIQFDAYGDRNHLYGWEIDHIVPTVMGGGDELSNLRPLWWAANTGRNAFLK
ncbi:MAG: HNH endonuclease signature motif containing protein [Azospirillaceae bacterium]